MGGGQNTTTQSTNNEPWSAAQPALKTGLSDAQTLYQGGVGGQTYTGSTVVPWAQQTTQGMDAQQNLAQSNMDGQGLSGQYQGIIDSGGYNPAQHASLAYTNGVGTNPFDLSGNSAYQSYKSSQLDDLQTRIDQSLAAGGRYGSGAHTANLSRELGRAGTEMDLAQMGRMDALNQQRFGMGQQGMNNLSTAYDAQKMPIQDMMQIGGMNEDLYGRQLNDQLRIFESTQNAPWEQLARLNAIASGAGQFGTSTTTAQMPGQNPLLTGLGYGMAGLGLLGGF